MQDTGTQHKQGTGVSVVENAFAKHLWEMQSLGTTFCLFGIPFHFFLWSFSIIQSQPEAAPNFSCAVVVKGFVVNVDIQRRHQYQHKNSTVHPNTQTRQRGHKKKLQSNNTNKHRCKKHQQNTSKPNATK